MRKILKLITWCVVVVVALGIGIVAVTPSQPHSREDIRTYAAQLFEFGAVRYVHGLESDFASAEHLLFDRVMAGEVLDKTESCTYRTAYWQVLQAYAGRFQAVDNDLHMATDFGADATNNCDGTGIMGLHDMHDLSAKQNFEKLAANLVTLKQGTGFFRSVLLINEVQKNLVDLTVHFAPATHAIGVMDGDFATSGPLSEQYNAMQQAFKVAQFAPVNSEEYWSAVDSALNAFSVIVFEAQQDVIQNSSVLERRLAGRWLSLQTVAPSLEIDACIRPRPNAQLPACN